MFDFEIKVAQTDKEKQAAFRLRFEIFRKELNNDKNITFKEDTETDIYDKLCDHLIVVDKVKNLIVGTYRLLLDSKADPKIGFYSEKFFEIKKIKQLTDRKLELSRSCVHEDYREKTVINLLWNGIANYIKENNVRYLFGSVRLNNTDPSQVSKVFSFIKQRYYAAEELRIYPLKTCAFKNLNQEMAISDYKEIFFGLPALVKGYLRLGVKVCGQPAWNPDFGSVVLFILLDIHSMSNSYKKHFLGL